MAAAPVLGVIGNCGEAKNHELVPQALIRVSKPAHVLHVGELSRMPSSELAMWLQLPDRHAAHHLGPRDDIPALLAACDLFLLPSRYEGLPLVAIEALCAGVPILAADVAPLQWLLEYPAATLAPIEAASWAAAIEKAVGRAWTDEVELSLERARIRFGPARGVREYIAVYERVLCSPEAGRCQSIADRAGA